MNILQFKETYNIFKNIYLISLSISLKYSKELKLVFNKIVNYYNLDFNILINNINKNILLKDIKYLLKVMNINYIGNKSLLFSKLENHISKLQSLIL